MLKILGLLDYVPWAGEYVSHLHLNLATYNLCRILDPPHLRFDPRELVPRNNSLHVVSRTGCNQLCTISSSLRKVYRN